MFNGLALINGGKLKNRYGDNLEEYQDGWKNIEI